MPSISVTLTNSEKNEPANAIMSSSTIHVGLSKKLKQSTLPLGSSGTSIDMRKKKQEKFEKCQAVLVVDAIPLSIATNQKFVEIFTGLCPFINVLSRRTISRKISELMNNVKAKLKEQLHESLYQCTTADIWSSKHRSYIGVSVHLIDANILQRQSGVLGVM